MLKVKTRLINAEGQNNIYKKIKDMLKVRKIPLALIPSARHL